MQCRERIGYAIEENERRPRHAAQTAERRGADLVSRASLTRTRVRVRLARETRADLQQRRRRLAVETDEVR